MKVVISAGHGKKIRGMSSEWLDEVDEARRVTTAGWQTIWRMPASMSSPIGMTCRHRKTKTSSAFAISTMRKAHTIST